MRRESCDVSLRSDMLSSEDMSESTGNENLNNKVLLDDEDFLCSMSSSSSGD